MSREHILHRVRTALGRSAGQALLAEAPPVMLQVAPPGDRVGQFCRALEALAGKTFVAASPAEASDYIARLISGKPAIATRTPLLERCGVTSLPGVSTQCSREACAAAAVGITSADYALAETGTLVTLACSEARLVSLLPPCHVALVARSRILADLDELLAVLPRPAEQASSMVLITGPSRTADIEMYLVRGVHGPGEIHAVIVEDETNCPAGASQDL